MKEQKGGVGCRARCWAAVCSKTLADWMGLDAVIKSELEANWLQRAKEMGIAKKSDRQNEKV